MTILEKIMAAVAALLFIVASGCGESDSRDTTVLTAPVISSSAPAEFQLYEESHFGFFRAGGSYPYMSELNVHWQRPHPGPFVWGQIEKIEGTYDWSASDRFVKNAQENAVLLSATIWPYADWDQVRCHEMLPGSPGRFMPTLGDYHGKPCDAGAYTRFLAAMVERYDGDGEDDMPGLVYPVKYWEVINEPEQRINRPFFKSDDPAAEYMEILKTTSETVRENDPDAKVLNGGIAYLTDDYKAFWESVLGGSNGHGSGSGYIDIISVHSVPATEDLNLIPLAELMDKLNLDKPVWVTEIQLAQGGSHGGNILQGPITDVETVTVPGDGTASGDTNSFRTEDDWAAVWVKYSVEAFGRGADRLFFFGLDNATPTAEPSLLVNCSEVIGGESEEDQLQMSGCRRQKPFYAVKTMVEKLDYFDAVEKLGEGQYRFSVQGRDVYVLWGSEPLPDEIRGKVSLTELTGAESQVDSAVIMLTDHPVFVELK